MAHLSEPLPGPVTWRTLGQIDMQGWDALMWLLNNARRTEPIGGITRGVLHQQYEPSVLYDEGEDRWEFNRTASQQAGVVMESLARMILDCTAPDLVVDVSESIYALLHPAYLNMASRGTGPTIRRFVLRGEGHVLVPDDSYSVFVSRGWRP